MILTEKVEINLNLKNIIKYKKLGYNGSVGDKIEIDVNDLSCSSHTIVKYQCDICCVEKYTMYRNLLKNDIIYCNKCCRIKTNKTNLNRYGGNSPLQNKHVLKKREKVYLEKYGFITNLMCDDTKKKIKQTNLEKYGVENPSQNEEIKNKKIETCLKNYGVENPLQNDEIFQKVQKSAHKLKEYKGYLYRGTYELDFIKNFHNKILIENAKSIDYIFNNSNKKYFPDYYLPDYNLIVEIKSNYTYECEKEQNEAKKNAAINGGFNFIFIINKDYSNFISIL
jgi:hypothetical protein